MQVADSDRFLRLSRDRFLLFSSLADAKPQFSQLFAVNRARSTRHEVCGSLGPMAVAFEWIIRLCPLGEIEYELDAYANIFKVRDHPSEPEINR